MNLPSCALEGELDGRPTRIELSTADPFPLNHDRFSRVQDFPDVG
ncbi:hypothetical protein [Nocardia sp. CA-290969]